MVNPNKSRMETYINTLREIGMNIKKDMTVLDLGCGNGSSVKALINAGFDAYGCDFQYKKGPFVEELSAQDRIRIIEQGSGYRLPFENKSMDLVISDQVFEHIIDYDESLREIHRVLKPEGVSLNIFPSRYTPLEPHLMIPLGTIIKRKSWICLWTAIGIRRKIDKKKRLAQVVNDNYKYLTTCTNYMRKSEIGEHLGKYFSKYSFCEHAFLKQNRKARALMTFIPFLPSVYSTLRDRVVFMEK